MAWDALWFPTAIAIKTMQPKKKQTRHGPTMNTPTLPTDRRSQQARPRMRRLVLPLALDAAVACHATQRAQRRRAGARRDLVHRPRAHGWGAVAAAAAAAAAAAVASRRCVATWPAASVRSEPAPAPLRRPPPRAPPPVAGASAATATTAAAASDTHSSLGRQNSPLVNTAVAHGTLPDGVVRGGGHGKPTARLIAQYGAGRVGPCTQGAATHKRVRVVQFVAADRRWQHPRVDSAGQGEVVPRRDGADGGQATSASVELRRVGQVGYAAVLHPRQGREHSRLRVAGSTGEPQEAMLHHYLVSTVPRVGVGVEAGDGQEQQESALVGAAGTGAGRRPPTSATSLASPPHEKNSASSTLGWYNPLTSARDAAGRAS